MNPENSHAREAIAHRNAPDYTFSSCAYSALYGHIVHSIYNVHILVVCNGQVCVIKSSSLGTTLIFVSSIVFAWRYFLQFWSLRCKEFTRCSPDGVYSSSKNRMLLWIELADLSSFKVRWYPRSIAHIYRQWRLSCVLLHRAYWPDAVL